MVDKVPFTQRGYEQIETELKNLKEVERPAVIAAIAEAREHGDLSENAEYHAAREKQSFIEGRIQELESVMSRAYVMHPNAKLPQAQFASFLTICDLETEQEVTYQLVSEYESNVKDGRVATSSPIGRALLGKVSGDIVEVKTPAGDREYEILGVQHKL